MKARISKHINYSFSTQKNWNPTNGSIDGKETQTLTVTPIASHSNDQGPDYSIRKKKEYTKNYKEESESLGHGVGVEC